MLALEKKITGATGGKTQRSRPTFDNGETRRGKKKKKKGWFGAGGKKCGG